MFPRRAALLPCLLVFFQACAGAGAPAFWVAAPAAFEAGEPVVLRLQETGRGADLERARRLLAAFLDAPLASPLERVAPPLRDLPAPAGCAWVALPDELGGVLGFASPLGRLALCRVDDGVDLTLDDFEQVVPQQVAGGVGLRLAIRPARRRALESLTASAGDAVLLFIREEQVLFAARLTGPLAGDVLLVGMPGGVPPPVLAARLGS